MSDSSDPIARASDWNKKVIEEFRANSGKVGGQFEGAPILLLHTTGAKSGQEWINPIMYQQVGGDLAVFASKAGAPTSPDWYHNLLASSRASIEVGTESYEVEARVAAGEERSTIWERQKLDYPGFAGYEEKTTRQIPVVVLHRVS